MDVILVRYSELGLKGRPVRRKFESLLVDNMLEHLALERVECRVGVEHGRIFLEVDDADQVVPIVTKVFGVSSASPARVTDSSLDSICREAASYAAPLLRPGMSFAVRARREGSHPYTSMDLGREAGSAIWGTTDDLRVDLRSPDLEVHVEVRDAKAYLFHRYFPGPGGLPLGSQGRVAAIVRGREGALAAWMMMKRGARTLVLAPDDRFGLRSWDPSLRVDDIAIEDAVRMPQVDGAVVGTTLERIDEKAGLVMDVPVFAPLIGMTEEEIEERGLGVWGPTWPSGR